jgi:choline dehydrogenase-like flavoprotein
MMERVRIAWRIIHNSRLIPYLKEIFGLTQSIVDSDSALADFIRDNCTTNFHTVGTAKMGPDSDAMSVVDQQCHVRGVEGLQVVDASVMPNIVSANTNRWANCLRNGSQ